MNGETSCNDLLDLSRERCAHLEAEVRRLRDQHEDDVSRLMRAGHENGQLRNGIERHRDNADQAWTRLLAPHPRDVELWSLLAADTETP